MTLDKTTIEEFAVFIHPMVRRDVVNVEGSPVGPTG